MSDMDLDSSPPPSPAPVDPMQLNKAQEDVTEVQDDSDVTEA